MVEENVQLARQNLPPFIDRGQGVVTHGALGRSNPNLAAQVGYDILSTGLRTCS